MSLFAALLMFTGMTTSLSEGAVTFGSSTVVLLPGPLLTGLAALGVQLPVTSPSNKPTKLKLGQLEVPAEQVNVVGHAPAGNVGPGGMKNRHVPVMP